MLWVNGFPLVVGETKTPVTTEVVAERRPRHPRRLRGRRRRRSSRRTCCRCHRGQGVPLRRRRPARRDLAAVGRRPTTLRAGARVVCGPSSCCSTQMLLDILRTYTLYSASSTAGGTREDHPALPAGRGGRGHRRAGHGPDRRQGLVWHHQGSGKTLLMAFAARELRTARPGRPTVLIVLDRLDLIEQTRPSSRSAGLPGLKSQGRKDELRRMLARTRAASSSRPSSGSRTPGS